MFKLDQAKEVLEFYAEVSPTLPDQLSCDCVVVARPGGAAFIMLDMLWSGSDFAEGEKAMAKLRSFGKPMMDSTKPTDYSFLQTRADGGTPAGKLYYNKSGLMTEISQGAINALVEKLALVSQAGADPESSILVIIQQLGGQIAQKANNDTAYVHRDARYDFLTLSGWRDPDKTDKTKPH